MPTFAEGFGLPVAEGLAAGAFVIASDIAAFRTIDAPRFMKLDPMDGPGWLHALETRLREPSELLPPVAIEPTSANTWQFGNVEVFLHSQV